MAMHNFQLTTADGNVYPHIPASQVYIDTAGTSLETYWPTLVNNILNFLYPVGYIYKSTVPQNMASLVPGTTWITLPAAKILVGAGTYTDSRGENKIFSASEQPVGEYFHRLTIAEMPSHRHQFWWQTGSTGDEGWDYGRTPGTERNGTGYTGSNLPHNNVMSSKVVYMYQRTA